MGEIADVASEMGGLINDPQMLETAFVAQQEVARRRKQQEFMDLILEAGETGDKSKLAAWWREHFPGWKWWCLGPSFQAILPDDSCDECVEVLG